jgi:small subunit ribosomal protein S4
MRHFGEVLTRAPKYAEILERRSSPPGQHGQEEARRTPSESGRRMKEKQKLKNIYSISEAQMRPYMELATRRKGITGENLVILERSQPHNIEALEVSSFLLSVSWARSS